MSEIINKFPIGSYAGQGGGLDIYVLIETDAIDYINMKRNFYIALVFEVQGEGEFTLAGNSSPFSCLGASVRISGDKTLKKGKNVLKGFIRQDIAGEYAPYSIVLEHSCAELGLTEPINVSGNIGLYPIYTVPAVNIAGAVRLGQPINVTGDFLDVGYDVTARVMLEGDTLCEENLTADKKYVQTSLDWILPYQDKSSLPAQIIVEGAFNGEKLPESRTIPVNLVLSAADGAPSVTAEHVFSSGVGAIDALGIAVKGKSKAIVRVSEINTRLGAKAETVQITLGGQTVNGQELESEVLDVAREYTYQVKVTDSRGFSGVYNGYFTVQDYYPPKFSATVKRVGADGIENKRGTYLYVEANLEDYYQISDANQCSFYFTVCKSGEDEGAQIRLENGSSALLDLGLDCGATYEVRVYCSDTFEGCMSKVYFLEKENIELNIAKNKIGIGKYAEKEKLLDCAWPIRCTGDISVLNDDGTEISLQSLGSSVYVCDVQDESSFVNLTTPSEGEAKLILMYLENDFFGYAKGYHLFFVFNHRGSGGNLEIKFN